MTLPHDCIGVDIAKDWIDVFFLSTSRHERIPKTEQLLARFGSAAKGCLVVLEASGGHERPVTEALARAGVACARVNPRQTREFARATGRLAKTDRVDAEVLARMGRALELKPTPPTDPDRQRLADLVARREALVGMIRAEKNRAGTTRDRWLAQEIVLSLRMLQDHLTAVEEQIAILVDTRDRLAAEARRLRSMPGIGPVGAAVLIARAPARTREPRRPPHRRPGRACALRLQFRSLPRETPCLGRQGRCPPRPLPRGLRRLAPRPHTARLPHSPSEGRKAHQSRPHRLCQKTPHHPQRNDPRPQGIRKTERMKTVATA